MAAREPGERQARRAVLSHRAEKERPSAEAAKLRERFEEAVAALKKQRRSGNSLYDLPWYVFIGAPGSGKTTALINSGLKFPLEQRVGKGAVRGVGGTRNCDWWFTDEAVFLDTAGRYTTQDSDAGVGQRRLEGIPRAPGQVPQAPPGERHRPHHQRPGPDDAGRRRSGSPRRGGAPSIERADPGAAHPAAGLRDGDQVRHGRRLHRVLRRSDAGGPRAGVGRDVPVRADAERRGAERGSGRSSTR